MTMPPKNSGGDTIKAIIIDDEKFACENLAHLLTKINGIALKKYFLKATEALDYLLDNPVDLIFLDIRMPGMDGFAFLDKLQSFSFAPAIIFVTGFEEFAIKAVKKAAFDFLLKPINEDELQECILRYKIERKQNKEKEKMEKLLNSLRDRIRIKFKSKNGFHLIDPVEIYYVESEGNYSWVHLINNKTEMITLQIGQTFDLLKPHGFFRINRQNIINLRYLYRVDRKKRCCYMKLDEKIIEFDMVKHKINDLLEEV